MQVGTGTYILWTLHLRGGLGRQDVNESALENAPIQGCKSCFSIAGLQKLNESDAFGFVSGSVTRRHLVSETHT